MTSESAKSAIANSSRLYPERPFLAVSLAVFRDERVLLMRRAAAPLANVFTLPGGVVELGETLEQACVREVEEETGVRAEVLCFNNHVDVIDLDEASRIRRHFLIASFVGLWISGEGSSSAEAAEVLWAEPRDLEKLRLTPRLAQIIENARRLIEAKR